jgi:hypothetical protein
VFFRHDSMQASSMIASRRFAIRSAKPNDSHLVQEVTN